MIADQQCRDDARLQLNANVVVEAGAGTGKTTLLTDRLLFLLLAGGPKGEGIDVTRLVALTFTEKAAGEIKIRLASALEDLLAALDRRPLPAEREKRARGIIAEAKTRFHRSDPALRAAAEQALQHLDRAQITTLHAFASYLLQLFPVESGLGPGFEVDAQKSYFDEIFSSEWSQWLDVELGENPPRRQSWLDILPWVPLADIQTLARELCRETVDLNQAGVPSDFAQKELKRYADEADALPKSYAHKPKGKILEVLRAICENIRRAAAASQKKKFDGLCLAELPGASWPAAWVEPDLESFYKELRRLAESVSPESEEAIRLCVGLVRPFVKELREKYRRRGWVTFDGLLARARALVRDNRPVRESLKMKFDALLVDEFQDTDPLQGEILLYLAEKPGYFARTWTNVQVAPGKIFVVGDPKQSIYRFRGADIRAYENFTNLLLKQGALKCELRVNFRAHDGLLGPVNACMENVMREEAGLQPRYLSVHPREGRPVPPEPSVELVLVEKNPEEEKLPPSASARAEARWAADWIAAHGMARRGGEASPPEGKFWFRHIALLVRSTTHLSAYLEAFKSRGVPYAVEADKYFYGTQEVLDFLNLLKVLDDPSDRISLVGLLRSPLAALDDRDVLSLSEARGLNYTDENWRRAGLPASAASRVQSLWEDLRFLREKTGRVPLAGLVQQIFWRTRLLPLASKTYNGEQTLSNLLKFGRLARDAGDARGASLKEFIGQVTGAMDDNVQEGESPLVDEHLDAVRVMTIHKAKGLEFPVVFLANLSATSRGGRGQNILADEAAGATGIRLPKSGATDAAYAVLELDERRREERERARLLYVALTRAREKMFLLGQADGASSGTLAGALQEGGLWPEKGERPEFLAPGPEHRVPAAYIVAGSGAPSRRNAEAVQPRADMDFEKLAALWRRRFTERDELQGRDLFSTPTSAHDGKLFEPAEDVEPAAESSPAHLVGQLCHAVLQEWDFHGQDDLETALRRARNFLFAGNPGTDWDRVVNDSRGILKEFLAGPAAETLARAEILGREMPFVMPRDNRVVRGSMDLLLRRDGKLWVADYKTDKVSKGDAARHAERYEPQGRAYAEAVGKALGEPCGFQVIFLRTGGFVNVFSPE